MNIKPRGLDIKKYIYKITYTDVYIIGNFDI